MEERNLTHFINGVNQGYTPELKIKIRDYYLYFLHVAGSNGIRPETMFVSTSADIRVARGFTKNTNGLIFHYFIPYPYHIFAIAPWIADHHQEIIKSINSNLVEYHLPTYQPLGLFPKQREVSVKGALFPQYILGIELINEKKFIVNTHILNINERDFEEVSRSGIPIDQSNFEQRIFDTGYIRWGETDADGNFQEMEIR